MGKYLISLKNHVCRGVSDGLPEMDLLKFTDAHFTALNWPTGGLGTPGHAWHHSIMKN